MSASTTASRQSYQEDEQSYQNFMLMETLIDKLKLLNYDEEFIKSLKMRPLNRHYFALTSNPGEQFFMFLALSSWLIKKCGINFVQPQEDDDPNSAIASILEALRSLDIAVDFSPSKLKKGSGLYVLQCLTNLVDKAMTKEHIVYKMPKPPVEEIESSQAIDDDDEAELALDRVEEEMAYEDSDLDEDNELDVDDLYLASAFLEATKTEEMIESNVTFEEWNLELERVGPLLKVSIKSNTNDWRSHLDMMKKYQNDLNHVSTDITTQLSKLRTDLDGTMEKVSKRERLINGQFEHILSQYRNLQEELSSVSEKYREVNVGVVERQKTLNEISDSLESVKQEMEERGATMSDGSPLVHIKKAIKDVKKELTEMDINIAVGEHMIVETKLREKSMESQLMRTSGL